MEQAHDQVCPPSSSTSNKTERSSGSSLRYQVEDEAVLCLKKESLMAVVVTKLEGEQIPEEMREASPQVLFRVTGVDGNAHYAQSDEEAAKLAVRLSEQNKKQ
jgi:uncharacterized spore protein YtfJ